MALPLTMAILLFTLLLGACGLVIYKLLAQQREMAEAVLQMARDTADSANVSNKAAATAHQKQASALVEALADATAKTITSVAGSMQAVYGPAVQDRVDASGSGAEPLAPWYAKEGSEDYSDPTDGMNVEGIMGPENVDGYDGLVTDDEPFGIPGLKVGA